MKLKTILSISALFIAVALFGQARVNKPVLKFESRSPKLLKATGWMLNEQTGKWVSNANAINDKLCTGLCVNKSGLGNFKWMQMAKMNIKGQKKYILMFEAASGAYGGDFNRDWKNFRVTNFIIIDSLQYTTLKSAVTEKTGKDVIIKSPYNGYQTEQYAILGGEDAYTETNLLYKIDRACEYAIGNGVFIINSQTVEGKDIVRFMLPEDTRLIKPIEKQYFELSQAEFKVLFWE